jgi:ankyrin repeat protein
MRALLLPAGENKDGVQNNGEDDDKQGDTPKERSGVTWNLNIDINCRDAHHQTPLHLACLRGQTGCVSFLLSAPGVDVNATSITGVSPMIMTAVKGHTEALVVMLRDPRVDPNAVGLRGRGAVAGAALHGHPEVLALLLQDERVDPNMADDMNRTPLLDTALHICKSKRGQTQARTRILHMLLECSMPNNKAEAIQEVLNHVKTAAVAVAAAIGGGGAGSGMLL